MSEQQSSLTSSHIKSSTENSLESSAELTDSSKKHSNLLMPQIAKHTSCNSIKSLAQNSLHKEAHSVTSLPQTSSVSLKPDSGSRVLVEKNSSSNTESSSSSISPARTRLSTKYRSVRSPTSSAEKSEMPAPARDANATSAPSAQRTKRLSSAFQSSEAKRTKVEEAAQSAQKDDITPSKHISVI
eukprot:GHVU01125808.1.p1 GENE.GHVU01125808.1~~GHVU01125808.1.p1  ORF type:complete len:185 (-),score=10.10 GHVU01125808.1:145-699(-)